VERGEGNGEGIEREEKKEEGREGKEKGGTENRRVNFSSLANVLTGPISMHFVLIVK